MDEDACIVIMVIGIPGDVVPSIYDQHLRIDL
jgi:hypothetical protein